MPKFNWPIIGHENIQNFLQISILNQTTTHAYLFYGPPGIGKSTMAQYFAMSLFCFAQGPKQTIPCGQCPHCQQIKKKIHPDVAWYQKQEDKKEISIEQIREIINKLSTTSFLGSYKIGIIQGADQLSLAAANSLLKTLEEPSQKTILILTSQSIHHIPKTILSRCLLIKYLPVPCQQIYKHLLDMRVDRSQAMQFAQTSFGLPGEALKLAKQKNTWQEYENNCRSLIQLIDAPVKDKFSFVEATLPTKTPLEENRTTLLDLFKTWQNILRDIVLLKTKKNDKIINNWAMKELLATCPKTNTRNLLKSIKKIGVLKLYLRKNVNPKLVLENFLLYI